VDGKFPNATNYDWANTTPQSVPIFIRPPSQQDCTCSWCGGSCEVTPPPDTSCLDVMPPTGAKCCNDSAGACVVTPGGVGMAVAKLITGNVVLGSSSAGSGASSGSGACQYEWSRLGFATKDERIYPWMIPATFAPGQYYIKVEALAMDDSVLAINISEFISTSRLCSYYAGTCSPSPYAYVGGYVCSRIQHNITIPLAQQCPSDTGCSTDAQCP
jgi:hypothetical protein